MDIHQGSIIIPALKIPIHGTAWRQVLRKGTPLTGGAKNIQNAVQHVADNDLALTAATLRTWNQRFDQIPLGIGQVAGIAQTLAVVSGAVLGRPHEAPRESVPSIESQTIRAGQALMLIDSKDS